ncbi:hypothetical protein [Nocardioides donggukensis]|uniref:Uncharacterized protein n=1 Tax=Nocardioides donggukensis TaxID=2774019 RepID=A0A927PZL3_9ACTN|nr:hypothetical protein [Nocardioides donggukensis]MBD8870388.1 hypothetical protein [Nocardioides donggukensis]
MTAASIARLLVGAAAIASAAVGTLVAVSPADATPQDEVSIVRTSCG